MMELHLIPNWSGGVKETYEFLTTVFTSRSGKEQRSAERMTPRRDVQFTSLLYGSALRVFKGAMHNRGNSLLSIPDAARYGATLIQDAPQSATEIVIRPVPTWLEDGVEISISEFLDSEQVGAFSVAQVSSFSTSYSDAFGNGGKAVITLDSGLSEAWSAGAQIRPVIYGRLEENVAVDFLTDAIAEVDVNFKVNPPSNVPDLGVSEVTTFDSRDVFLVNPNWVSAPRVQYDTPYESVDYDRGVIETYLPIDFYTKVTQFNYSGRGGEDIKQILSLFVRMKGRRGEFWSPSWLSDLEPLSQITSGGNTLLVRGSDVRDDYSGSTVDSAIAIMKKDGSWVFGKVSSLTYSGSTPSGAFNLAYDEDFDAGSGSGIYTLITFEDNFTETVARKDIEMVCWLNLCRFASDALTIEWLTDNLARCVLNIMTLETLDAET